MANKNMRLLPITRLILLLVLIPGSGYSEDRIELKITTIKGNKELPKILYVVPWKDIEQSKSGEQKLVLHSLFGNLFDPVLPDESNINN